MHYHWYYLLQGRLTGGEVQVEEQCIRTHKVFPQSPGKFPHRKYRLR